MRQIKWSFLIGLVVWCSQASTVHAAPWRVELLEPPGIVNVDLDSDRPKLTITNDGSLLAYPLSTRLRDSLDDDGYSAFARLGTTGATATFSTGAVGVNVDGTLLADGSLVTVGTTVERVASDGTLIWSVLNPVGVDYGSAVQISSDALLLAVAYRGRMQLRRLNLDNGAITDALDAGTTAPYECFSVPLVSDANGSAFIGDSCYSRGIVKVLDSPLRLDPNWQPSPVIASVGDLRFDGGALYAAVSSENRDVFRKFDPATGTTLWTYPDSGGSEFSVFGQFDLIDGVVLIRALNATFEVAIQRLDPATGTLLWTYAPTLNVKSAAAAGGDLIIGGTRGSTYEIDQARGFMERISLATGVPSWQSTLSAPQGGGSTLSSVAIQGNQAVAIGAGCPLASYGLARCDATLWRNALASGVSIEAAPIKVRTGNVQVGVLETPPTQPVVATLEMGGSGPQLHIRSFAGSNGVATLDVVTPVKMTFPWILPEYASVIKAGDGNYIALLTTQRQPDQYPDAVITKIDGSSGAVVWQHSLFDVSLERKDLDIVRVSSDSAGSVFFNVAYERQSGEQVESLIKLGSASGDVVWEVPVPRRPLTPLFASAPELIGDDVLSYFYLPATGGAEWRKLRGSDGSVVWSSASLPVFPNVVGDSYIYGTRVSGSDLTVARIDPQTGGTVCSGTHVSNGDVLTPNGIALRASDGDIYVAARRGTGADYKALVVRFSGSTCSPVWANRFDETTSSGAQFYPRFVDGDVLYLSGRPASFQATSANILTMVSSATGSLIGSQVMYQGGWRDPSSVRASGFPFGLDGDGGLILMAASREPGQPTRTIIEKRAAPASAVVGALHIDVEMAAAPMPGSAGFDFVITVVNDGATVAPDVRTITNFGIDVRLDSVACLMAGSPCQASVIGSTVRSTSSLAVGTTLTLTGRASVPAASIAQITVTGSAFAPYGFSEINLSDNILPASLPFRDFIFANGVESMP